MNSLLDWDVPIPSFRMDAAGFIPDLGEVADLANAIGYALEGDWTNAGISALGVVPVVGDLAKAGRLVKKVVKEVVEGVGSKLPSARRRTPCENRGRNTRVCNPSSKE